MKIWYVTMVFPTPSETFVCTEVAALRARGVDVSVHAFGSAPPGSKAMLAEHGLTETRIDALTAADTVAAIAQCILHPLLAASLIGLTLRWSWRTPMHVVKSLLLIPRAVQLFLSARRERPDVVHLFWGHYPSLLGHLVLEHLPDVVLSLSLSAYDLRIAYGCTTPVARRARFVRTWARVNLPAIEALGVDAERVGVHYQLIDCDRREALDTSEKVARRVVSAGRLIPAKGMDEVLRVFARVHAQWPDTSLVILGDGPERGSLESLARDLGLAHAVEFKGHVPYNEVFVEMAKAEVFLFMSHHPAERLPNVVKEAILARSICVVTDTPGIEELVRDGEGGHVIAQHDVEAATQRLQEIFAGETSVETTRLKALARLRENFDVEQVIPQLIERWRRLVDR